MSKYILFILLNCFWISPALPVPDTYTLSGGYRVTILGTSNLRNWKDTVDSVAGMVTASLNADAAMEIYSLLIKMQVTSIKSSLGNALDSKTYRALKASANPEIIFRIDVPVKIKQVSPGDPAVLLKGYLTLAGVCKPVIMQVDALNLAGADLRLEGSQSLSMTDYGIKPPSTLFGAVKAGPEITIHFKTNFICKQNKK